MNVGAGSWPRYAGAKSRVAAVRRQLDDALGPMCGGCGGALGVEADHDHFTGLLRRLLSELVLQQDFAV
ncbi:hypothetical protein ACWD33_18440 [Streptomyces xiamenensis]|uniref:hypothetical protein n=1 Tax=Streptomyces xiamenensis TaxID=408015 RepID=UPI0035D53B12